jgi:HK97 family phage major capsid protein
LPKPPKIAIKSEFPIKAPECSQPPMDGQSRPLVVPTMTEGLYPSMQFKLMGWPVFVTPFLSETESVGSGSNQSHLISTNPGYIHLAQDGDIEMAVSVERYFDANQTALRAVQHEDWAVAPAAGVIVLQGIS